MGLGVAALGAAPAHARDRRPAGEPRARERPRPIESPHEGAPQPDASRPRVAAGPPRARVNPVAFWSNAALALNALDHSIEAANARAPGPCAATLAMALAFTAMADAAAVVYPAHFEGYLVRGPRIEGAEYPEAFIGGACAQVLEHIYSTPAHSQLLGMQRLAFLRLLDGGGLDAWKAGLAFGRRPEYIGRWNWRHIKYAATGSSHLYRPKFGIHDVDPFNPDQKFYGVTWGALPPLVPELTLAGVGPGPPPTERDREFRYDAEEVRDIGLYRPSGPTREQAHVGLYWAYDGARLIGTPNRLYIQIVRDIVERDGYSMPEMARALALCAIAMADGAIVCWQAKYVYKVWRPVQAMPHLFRETRGWRPLGSPRTNPTQFALGGETRIRLTAISMMGGGYRTAAIVSREHELSYRDACFTPNFPSYPSGHATFGAACFRMLTLTRREREQSHQDPGRLDRGLAFVSDEMNGLSIDNFHNEVRPLTPVPFRTLEEMIESNNRSRVYLGVHWNFDCVRGAESGARIADIVYRRAYRRRDHSS